ncbi:hypothetical protein WH47_08385, partial [Habropoda laboriosa]
IWTFAPKQIHSGVTTVQIATYLALCIRNEGLDNIPTTHIKCIRNNYWPKS